MYLKKKVHCFETFHANLYFKNIILKFYVKKLKQHFFLVWKI